MQRLLLVVPLAIVLVGLPLLVLSDTSISRPDTAIPDNEVTDNVNTVGDCSVSATAASMMTRVLGE